MRALVVEGRCTVALRDRPEPRPGPGEVLIEVRASGICHTDLEILRDNSGTWAYPVVPGHESAGTVLIDPALG